jgi:hypothetical protein
VFAIKYLQCQKCFCDEREREREREREIEEGKEKRDIVTTEERKRNG